MRRRGTLSVAFAALSTACAGGDGPGGGLTESVPWEAPADHPRGFRVDPEPAPDRSPVELVIHGTELIDQRDDEVVVLTLLELHHHGSRRRPLPHVDIRSVVLDASQRTECHPAEVTIEDAPSLAPGERRLVWAQSRCPVSGDAPKVVRSFAWLPELDSRAHDAGRTIVPAPRRPNASAPIVAGSSPCSGEAH